MHRLIWCVVVKVKGLIVRGLLHPAHVAMEHVRWGNPRRSNGITNYVVKEV